ncbi:MAG: CsbD family protein [Solimonas sp.]
MNRTTLKGQWKQVKGRAKETWGKLTDDDLLRIEGSAERLAGLVQGRYGVTRDEAGRQIDRFLSGLDDPGVRR